MKIENYGCRSNGHWEDDYVTLFRMQQRCPQDLLSVWQMLVKAKPDLGEFLILRDGTAATTVPVEPIAFAQSRPLAYDHSCRSCLGQLRSHIILATSPLLFPSPLPL